MSTESSPSRYAELKCPPGGWHLPESMRAELAEGFGTTLGIEELRSLKGSSLITVGDMVSLTALNLGLKPRAVIYDGMTERRPYLELEPLLLRLGGRTAEVSNPAGRITLQLIEAIGEALSSDGPVRIKVTGEEDLAALACTAMAPLGTCVVYGVPGKGMALVRVDEQNAGRARSMIYSMEEMN